MPVQAHTCMLVQLGHHTVLLVSGHLGKSQAKAAALPAPAQHGHLRERMTGLEQILPSQIPKLFQNLLQNPLPPQDVLTSLGKQTPKLPLPAYKVIRTSPLLTRLDLRSLPCILLAKILVFAF